MAQEPDPRKESERSALEEKPDEITLYWEHLNFSVPNKEKSKSSGSASQGGDAKGASQGSPQDSTSVE